MHTSLVWHRDASSYLDEYEGRTSCELICTFIGLMLDVMEICCYTHILWPYGDTHCDVAYES